MASSLPYHDFWVPRLPTPDPDDPGRPVMTLERCFGKTTWKEKTHPNGCLWNVLMDVYGC